MTINPYYTIHEENTNCMDIEPGYTKQYSKNAADPKYIP